MRATDCVRELDPKLRPGPRAAVAAGCTAVIAPEGSIRDAEVVAAADRLGIALVL